MAYSGERERTRKRKYFINKDCCFALYFFFFFKKKNTGPDPCKVHFIPPFPDMSNLISIVHKNGISIFLKMYAPYQ